MKGLILTAALCWVLPGPGSAQEAARPATSATAVKREDIVEKGGKLTEVRQGSEERSLSGESSAKAGGNVHIRKRAERPLKPDERLQESAARDKTKGGRRRERALRMEDMPVKRHAEGNNGDIQEPAHEVRRDNDQGDDDNGPVLNAEKRHREEEHRIREPRREP